MVSEFTTEPNATLRVRMNAQDTTYRSVIIPAARIMGLFADCVTQVTLREDGDGSLLAAYENAQFKQSVHIGDYLEIQARVIKRGNRSRHFAVVALRHIKTPGPGEPDTPPAVICASPEVVAEAVLVVVVRKKDGA
ncbi:hotdog fold domain-containing protein [Rhizobium ruizarguesonis]|uniref:hotdog fold domain-containing protein n=1 Tax=Rhizobium ruizarguesonis TaxID=2081791 RepID=UPI001FE2280E|nr:hotdog fold domain-containing protein [Rhizobium ruizarguesonis]WSH62049.1 hotdog fold domain-containing protein [Rhizobium ruizarguesonis]